MKTSKFNFADFDTMSIEDLDKTFEMALDSCNRELYEFCTVHKEALETRESALGQPVRWKTDRSWFEEQDAQRAEYIAFWDEAFHSVIHAGLRIIIYRLKKKHKVREGIAAMAVNETIAEIMFHKEEEIASFTMLWEIAERHIRFAKRVTNNNRRAAAAHKKKEGK